MFTKIISDLKQDLIGKIPDNHKTQKYCIPQNTTVLLNKGGVQRGLHYIGYIQSWFAVEYSSCFISVMNLDLYVRLFDSLLSRGPSRGPNNFYVYI